MILASKQKGSKVTELGRDWLLCEKNHTQRVDESIFQHNHEYEPRDDQSTESDINCDSCI